MATSYRTCARALTFENVCVRATKIHIYLVCIYIIYILCIYIIYVYICICIYNIYIYIHTHTHTHTYTGGPRYNLQLHSYAPRVHYFRASQKRHACRVRKPPLVDKYFFFGFFFGFFSKYYFKYFFNAPHRTTGMFPIWRKNIPALLFLN